MVKKWGPDILKLRKDNGQLFWGGGFVNALLFLTISHRRNGPAAETRIQGMDTWTLTPPREMVFNPAISFRCATSGAAAAAILFIFQRNAAQQHGR